jgi:hypothetical protein
MYAWVLFPATSSSRAEDPVLAASVLTETQQRRQAVSEEAHPWGCHQNKRSAVEGKWLALCELPAQAAPHSSNGPDAPAFARQSLFISAIPTVSEICTSTSGRHQLTCTFSHHGLADTSRILPSDTVIWEMLGSRLLVCSRYVVQCGSSHRWNRLDEDCAGLV